jgi:peptidoglycan LD-endopeptidase LytH
MDVVPGIIQTAFRCLILSGLILCGNSGARMSVFRFLRVPASRNPGVMKHRPRYRKAESYLVSLAVASLLAPVGSARADTRISRTSSVQVDLAAISQAVQELRAHRLLLPIAGAEPENWRDSFYAKRGDRQHNAVDMMTARNTPVLAVEDGVICRVGWNDKGGNTIYQHDPSGRFIYYYAHLERLADGLKQGQFVGRGQVIGYVGTTGNAPPNAPHLHFSIDLANNPGSLGGTPINPYEVFTPVPFAPARQQPLPRGLATGPASLPLRPSRSWQGPSSAQSSVNSGQFSTFNRRPGLNAARAYDAGWVFDASRPDPRSIGPNISRRALKRWIIGKSKKWLRLGLR